MDRRFMLWFGWPFIVAVVITIGLGFLAPNLLVGFVFIMLVALAAFGLLGSIGYAIIQVRAGNSWAEALNPIASLLVVVGLSFGAQYLGINRGARTDSAQPRETPQISTGIKLATIHDGHFRTTAVIGSQTVPFIVDVKTEHLLLKHEDAERLGIDTASLTYDRDVMINGRSVKGATVTLPSLRIATVSISNTPAIVIADPMPENIIGFYPLQQFGDWRLEPAGLILNPAN